MLPQLPTDWQHELRQELDAGYFQNLQQYLSAERGAGVVFPAPERVFRAFELTPFASTSVVLLGQDPYHGEGQADGLCFSVPPDTRLPPSLRNIYKELSADLKLPAPKSGNLSAWATQGVLLLNSVLTVRAHQAASHKDQGWERFTDAVMARLATRKRPVVFVLWGSYAQRKQKFIPSPHRVLTGVHPSPLSASRGFFGSRPFSTVNRMLEELGERPINWTA
ncbi:MAG: hypothetical protein RJA70_2331 [Pseudomonadota bacterium]